MDLQQYKIDQYINEAHKYRKANPNGTVLDFLRVYDIRLLLEYDRNFAMKKLAKIFGEDETSLLLLKESL